MSLQIPNSPPSVGSVCRNQVFSTYCQCCAYRSLFPQRWTRFPFRNIVPIPLWKKKRTTNWNLSPVSLCCEAAEKQLALKLKKKPPPCGEFLLLRYESRKEMEGLECEEQWPIVSQRHFPTPPHGDNNFPYAGEWGAKKNPGGTSVATKAADRWQRLRQAVRPDQSSQNSQTSVCLVGWYRWQGLVPRPIRVLICGICARTRQRLRAMPWMLFCFARYVLALFFVQNFLSSFL